MKKSYEDIINLLHHVSATRPQMSRENRAAQFSPFSALTGYEAAIKETARITDERIVLGESAIADLDMKLSILSENVTNHPEVMVTYFQSDENKDGGFYVTISGLLRKLDDYEHTLVVMDGTKIAISDILEIESELFGDDILR